MQCAGNLIFSNIDDIYLNATVFNPLFLPRGSYEVNFLIISCVPAH